MSDQDKDALRAHHLRTSRPRAQLRQGRTDWYRITNHAETDTAELYIYDEIGYFGVTAADLVNELKGVTAKSINVRVNSPGGDVFDGIAILNALRQHPAAVNVVVDSLAASAASFIAMAGDTVTMAPNSQMMIHAASGLTIGNAADMREMADLLDKMTTNIASIYAGRAGGKVEDWLAAMNTETWYSAEEAVAAGLADKVGTTAMAGASNTWDLSIYAKPPTAVSGTTSVVPLVAAVADETSTEPAQDAEPDGPVFEFDPAAFAASLREGFHQAVDDARPTHEPAQPEPVFAYDADMFREALKEAAG